MPFATISFFLNLVTNLLEAYSNFYYVSVILFNVITFENLRSSWGIMTETQWWSMLFMDCWQDICVSCHKLTRVWCVWEQRCLEWNKSQVYVQAWWYYITKGDPMYTLIILLAMHVGNMKWNPVFLIGNLSGQDEPILSTQDCPLCSCARKNGLIKLVTFA